MFYLSHILLIANSIWWWLNIQSKRTQLTSERSTEYNIIWYPDDIKHKSSPGFLKTSRYDNHMWRISRVVPISNILSYCQIRCWFLVQKNMVTICRSVGFSSVGYLQTSPYKEFPRGSILELRNPTPSGWLSQGKKVAFALCNLMLWEVLLTFEPLSPWKSTTLPFILVWILKAWETEFLPLVSNVLN